MTPRRRQRGFIIDPFRHGGGTESGVLASHLADLWGAYGLQQLRSLYAGNCIRVRRSSDDAELNIPFAGGVVDTTALAAFVGANDGFVVTWFDQSGNLNHLEQATNAAQPKIVDAGTYTGELLWDGVDDVLVSANPSGTPVGLTLHLAGRDRYHGATAVLLNLDTQAFVSGAPSGGGTNYGGSKLISISDTGNTVTYDLTDSADGVLHSYVFDRAPASVALEHTCYRNGSTQAQAATAGLPVGGNFTAADWYVGANSTGTAPARLAARTLLIYEAAQSGATVAAISALVAPATQLDGLAGHTSSLWAALALKRLLSGYAGSCIRVRRSSDNTEQDIGFSSGLLDTAALASFVGANDGFIVTWYDQSGGANHFSQATAARQPAIVLSGVVQSTAVFGATNRNLVAANNSGTPSAFTLFHRGYFTATAENVLEHSTDYNAATGAIWFKSSLTSQTVGMTETSSANRSGRTFAIGADNQMMAARLDRSQASSALQNCLFSGGVKLTASGNIDAGSLPTGNFGAVKWHWAGRNGALTFTDAADVLVIYETAKSDADIERISRALG